MLIGHAEAGQAHRQALAEELAVRRQAAWRELLGFAPALDFVVERLEETIRPLPEVVYRLARLAHASRTRRQAEYRELRDLAAAALDERDRDGHGFAAAVARLGCASPGAPAFRQVTGPELAATLHRIDEARRAWLAARDRLLAASLPLVARIAAVFAELAEGGQLHPRLIDAGAAALVEASSRYRSHFGSFDSYAESWVSMALASAVIRGRTARKQPMRRS